MNNYFSLSSTSTNDLFSTNGSTNNNNNNTGSSSNGDLQTGNNDINNSTSFSYDTDYNRGGFSSTFDRLAFSTPTNNKDQLMNTYSNFTMMQAAAAASISSSTSHHHHHQQQQQQQQQQIHLQQHPSTNDYLLPPSNGTSSWKQPEPISSSSITATPGNDMITSATMPPPHPHHQLSSFSMAVTNPMFYYAHPWMRPGREREREELKHQES
jgi:hypothetical protein